MVHIPTSLIQCAKRLFELLETIDVYGVSNERSQECRSLCSQIGLLFHQKGRHADFEQLFEDLQQSLEQYLKISNQHNADFHVVKSLSNKVLNRVVKVLSLDAVSMDLDRSRTDTNNQFSELLSVSIQASAVRGKFNNVYVLGCFEAKKTILTQQKRAILLCAGILNSWPSGRKQPKVAIIGGGIGGITAFCTLLRGGADVRLFERDQNLMPLQRLNSTRYLHPNLFDWPRPGSEKVGSHLPLMNWTADYSNNVVQQLDAELNQTVSQYAGVAPEVCKNVQDIQWNENTLSYTLTFTDSAYPEDGFNIVVIAIGFGTETSADASARGYWDNEAILRAGHFSAAKVGRILVSGSGDGALIDVLRAAIHDFKHDSILRMVPELAKEEIKTKLLQIEDEATRERQVNDCDSFRFSNAYREILKDITLSDAVRDQINKHVRVTFNSERPGLYQLGSSILNRVLVHLLIVNGLVDISTGRVLSVSQAQDQTGISGGYQVLWKNKLRFSMRLFLGMALTHPRILTLVFQISLQRVLKT